jgi:putative transposase
MGTKFNSGRIRKVYEFMRMHRHQFNVRLMCRALEVNPSAYYAWLKQPQSRRSTENARLVKLIRASFNASNGICSSPRVTADTGVKKRTARGKWTAQQRELFQAHNCLQSV